MTWKGPYFRIITQLQLVTMGVMCPSAGLMDGPLKTYAMEGFLFLLSPLEEVLFVVCFEGHSLVSG